MAHNKNYRMFLFELIFKKSLDHAYLLTNFFLLIVRLFKLIDFRWFLFI
jgi:hypothetical protein